jgi:SAM-dependent methyltransferase
LAAAGLPATAEPWDRLLAAGRRLLDLQAASAWNDLKVELASAQGDVLDVGAGAQPFRPLLPADARYRAIDVAVAGEAFGYEVPDTEYFEGDRWSVEDASVEVVLATETLEHVPEPAIFLAEARRVLRPGGRLASPSRSRPAGTTPRTTTGATPHRACRTCSRRRGWAAASSTLAATRSRSPATRFWR